MAMKIVHIIEGLPQSAGTTVFALELARAQANAGHKVYLVCFRDSVVAIPYGVSFLKVRSLDSLLVVPDIVHVHALWSPCNAYTMRWCESKHYKYIISVHGCLMPRVFAKRPIKKWLFYWVFLKSNIKRASAIHCTSEYEKQVCESLGFKGPFIVAPLGVDIPENVKRKEDNNCRTVLFVGRLGEEKGLINLLEVWKKMPRSGWRLVLAGPDWLGYKEILDEKIAKESIDGVEFVGEVYGDKKEALYRSADIFVLPSPIENFSMVVLEALSYGVPAIATKGTPWEVLNTHKCGWWVDQGVEHLGKALQTAMSLNDGERREMGMRGRKVVEDGYTWDIVAEKINMEYSRLVQHTNEEPS